MKTSTHAKFRGLVLLGVLLFVSALSLARQTFTSIPGNTARYGSLSDRGTVANMTLGADGLIGTLLLANGGTTDLGMLVGPANAGNGTNDRSETNRVASAGKTDARSSADPHDAMPAQGALDGTVSEGHGLTNYGAAAGSFQGSAGGSALLYAGGGMTNFGSFGGGGSIAIPLNSAGQAAVNASAAAGSSQSPLYSSGGMANMGSLGSYRDAIATKDGGNSAGGLTVPGTVFQPNTFTSDLNLPGTIVSTTASVPGDSTIAGETSVSLGNGGGNTGTTSSSAGGGTPGGLNPGAKPQTVPEAAHTIALLAFSMAGLVLWRRRSCLQV